MGLRIRKSINLGGGARINLSKSGIGYSIGTKGARITKKAKGGSRATLSVPGTGLSYVKESSGETNRAADKQKHFSGNGRNYKDPEKRKKWLWVIGWICIFPLPLTILLLRKKDMKAPLKYGLIISTWLLYLLIVLVAGDNSKKIESNSSVEETIIDRSVLETTVVPEPAGVESVRIIGESGELILGSELTLTVSVLPENAKDKEITWNTSDDSVVLVNDKGVVNAIGGGHAIITAETSNGCKASFDVNVDGSKRIMDLRVRHKRDDDNNIGDEWSYTTELNGEPASGVYTVSVGDKLNCRAKFVEEDDNPDIGEVSKTYTVTEENFQNGFEIPMELYVTENGGRNSGKSAHFLITYTFSIK